MEMQNNSPIGGEDRRLKQFPQQPRHENHRALKCPRCDSLDTKFCYYNNYNFSQPRHFCKTCRRYWTIGGILRNIPVGGGSRKSKNSKLKPTPPPRDPGVNFHAFVNSSTAVATHALPTMLSSKSQLLNVQNATSAAEDSDFGMSSEIGSVTSLMTSSNERIPFVLSYIQGMTPLKLNQVASYYNKIRNEVELKPLPPCEEMEKNLTTAGFPYPTSEILAQNDKWSGGGYGWLERRGGGNEGLVDIGTAMDQASWFSHCGLNTPFIFD